MLVICPGRGTYAKQELGYLKRYHSDKSELISSLDNYRGKQQQTAISELDNRQDFVLKEHSRGDNASPLIYACAYSDFLSIDTNRYEVVAITGNSMGWYIAMACARALGVDQAMQVINTMGNLMHESLIGGQLIYPLVDENWRAIPGRRKQLKEIVEAINSRPECQLFTSIELGGMLVFGGNNVALNQLTTQLPSEQERFPMRLYNHAAFHTPLQSPISKIALSRFDQALFDRPQVPMVDGRGQIWTPYSTSLQKLFDYTFGHQVVEHYDFTKAIEVSVKEFAPDKLVILGPGKTLGGAVAQSLINIQWQGMTCKQDFVERQREKPLVLSMGMDEQRQLVTC
ncbi:acyl carrier protein [Motiliproteus sp. MSK22-1]|nr:acyl carrier protein [Motiliproteus sp. MSK22-1]